MLGEARFAFIQPIEFTYWLACFIALHAISSRSYRGTQARYK
jgi:hypothetical protein